MMAAVDPPLSSFHRGHQAFSTVKLKTSPYGETGINENTCAPLDVREMAVPSDFGKAFAPSDIKCHLSTASTSTGTGTPNVFSSSTSMTTQVFDIGRHHVSRAPFVTSLYGETPQETLGVQTSDDHSLVSRDSKMASDEEISDICPTLVHFVATLEQQFLTIDDLLADEAVDPFMDDATANDIVAAHVSFDKTLLFDSIFTSAHHSTLEPIVSAPMMIEPRLDSLQCIDGDDEFCPTTRRNTDDAAVLLSIPLGALDTTNSNPFEPLWIICSVLCAPSSHETLRLTSQDHGEIFTDQSQKFVLDIATKNQENDDAYGSDPLVLESKHGSVCISIQVDIQDLMCLLTKMSIDLSIRKGSSIAAAHCGMRMCYECRNPCCTVCIDEDVTELKPYVTRGHDYDILHDYFVTGMCVRVNSRHGTYSCACDDPLLSMHDLGHQSFPSVKYKQIQYDGITSSFEASTDYDAVSSTNLEWICQDPFDMKTKQIQSDRVVFSFCMNVNFDVTCTHYETIQILTRTSVMFGAVDKSNRILTMLTCDASNDDSESVCTDPSVDYAKSPNCSFVIGMETVTSASLVLQDCNAKSNEFSNSDYFKLDVDSFKPCVDNNKQSPFVIDGSTLNTDSSLPLSDTSSDPTKATKSAVITRPQPVDGISNPKSELKNVASEQLAVDSDDPWLTTFPDDLSKSSPHVIKSSSSSSTASTQPSCHPTLLKTIDAMAEPLSYGDLVIDGLPGTKVLISPALMGRDELSDSIFEQHLQLETPSDSDATVLPFDRGPAKVLMASTRSLELLPFDRGPTSHLPILQAVSRFAFEDTKICSFLHLGFISYVVLLVLKALPTLTVEQAICGLSLELAHIIPGRSVTGILHFQNKFPIDWYSKKQATVETATYGSEYISARTCVDQIVDLRTTLRYLGVPVRDVSYMFGDNESVVNSSTQPHSRLHKRHNALSFHRVREAIASGYVVLTHLPGKFNPADILSKHWGYQTIWPILKPILFFHGDTADLIQDDDAV